MQSVRLKDASGQRHQKQRDLLGLTVVITLAGLGVVTFLQLCTLLFVSSIAHKAPPSLVQLADGTSITTAPLNNTDRTEQVIQRFVTEKTAALMTWSGRVNTVRNGVTFPIADKGVKVDINSRSYKLPTSAWQAGFSLSEDFRPDFLKKIAEMVPPGVFNEVAQVTLIPGQITKVEKVAEGKWKVTMVATLLTFTNQQQLGESIPFNKEVYVRAVIPPQVNNQSSELEQLIAEVRKSGLEIYAITDIQQQTLQ